MITRHNVFESVKMQERKDYLLILGSALRGSTSACYYALVKFYNHPTLVRAEIIHKIFIDDKGLLAINITSRHPVIQQLNRNIASWKVGQGNINLFKRTLFDAYWYTVTVQGDKSDYDWDINLTGSPPVKLENVTGGNFEPTLMKKGLIYLQRRGMPI